MNSVRWLGWLAVLLVIAFAAVASAADGPQGFKHRGFYLHEGWLYKHPFAVRSWSQDDFANMYQVLSRLGFDRVMNWPMFESMPAPLSEADAKALVDYRRTIDDAHAAGLEFWLVQTPNLTPPQSIAAKPWKERNPYPVWKHVRLDDPAEAAAYFAHRRAMMKIVNSADAYVTIDGDPGGYPGARPEEWLSVFLADRAAIDAHGTAPTKQRVIPWVWCGWGTDSVWGGNANHPPERIMPFVKASLEKLGPGMPEPWGLLPNLYFFARGAADLSYLDTPDEKVLGDLADLLGGPRDLLVPAWRCMALPLEGLPADLPARLRKAELSGEAGRFIPGGQRRYLNILAAEVESRRGFLEAIAKPVDSSAAAANLAAATMALVGWWQVHGYVNAGDENTPFSWQFVRGENVNALRAWVQANVQDREAVIAAAAKSLAASGTLGEEEAVQRLTEVAPGA